MNIFTFSPTPEDNPCQLIDKHVVKMLVEHCQLLSTAHHILNSDIASKMFSPSHQNHPSMKWVMENWENYWWLYQYTEELANEYEYRYGRKHKVVESGLLKLLSQVPLYPDSTSNAELTPVTPAMKDEFKIEGERSWRTTIRCYRNYYVRSKAGMAAWTGREPPDWYVRGLSKVLGKKKTVKVEGRVRKIRGHQRTTYKVVLPPARP